MLQMRRFEDLSRDDAGLLVAHAYAIVAHGRTTRNANAEVVDLVPHLRACRHWCAMHILAERLVLTFACLVRLLEEDNEQARSGCGRKGKGAAGHYWALTPDRNWFRSDDASATLGQNMAAHVLSHPGAHLAYGAAIRTLGPQHHLCSPPNGLQWCEPARVVPPPQAAAAPGAAGQAPAAAAPGPAGQATAPDQ